MGACATYDIDSLSVSAMRDEAGELLRAHWGELAKHKHLMRLRPNWIAYEQLEAAGMLLSLGVRTTDDNRLVGYSVSFLHRHLHYSDLLYAQNDVLYVEPEHRGRWIGRRLFRATEKAAVDAGAQLMLWHAKQGSELDRMLDHSRDYSVQDVLYGKEI